MSAARTSTVEHHTKKATVSVKDIMEQQVQQRVIEKPYRYEQEKHYHYEPMKKKYLEMWHKAQTASNLDKKSIADIAIFNTFNSINAEYRSRFEEGDLEKMPSVFSNLKNGSGVVLTEDCTFTSASSPLIALSPMTYVGIGCEVRGAVGCDMGKCLQAAAPTGFEVKNIVNGKTWVYKSSSFWNKSIDVKVDFLGVRGKDRSHKPVKRAKLMQELSEKLSEDEKKAVQLLMTVVTFARLSHDMDKKDVADVALITLGYCLVKNSGAGWDEMVETMKDNSFMVNLDLNLECKVQEELYKEKFQHSTVTIVENESIGIPYYFMNFIMEQYDALVQCVIQP
eukprot:GHVS01014039.1.p1 GENE.GHVS01014039.1~~GHVS01014039.1.p1  ORF type:complete len:338 (+),score=32.98 GHVS01014039.1:242-1255(+)